MDGVTSTTKLLQQVMDCCNKCKCCIDEQRKMDKVRQGPEPEPVAANVSITPGLSPSQPTNKRRD